MWFEKFVIKYTAFSSITIQSAKNVSISPFRKKINFLQPCFREMISFHQPHWNMWQSTHNQPWVVHDYTTKRLQWQDMQNITTYVRMSVLPFAIEIIPIKPDSFKTISILKTSVFFTEMVPLQVTSFQIKQTNMLVFRHLLWIRDTKVDEIN